MAVTLLESCVFVTPRKVLPRIQIEINLYKILYKSKAFLIYTHNTARARTIKLFICVVVFVCQQQCFYNNVDRIEEKSYFKVCTNPTLSFIYPLHVKGLYHKAFYSNGSICKLGCLSWPTRFQLLWLQNVTKALFLCTNRMVSLIYTILREGLVP